MNEKALTTKAAAIYLGISQSTLRQGRMNGARDKRCPTPPYIKIGRAIRYRIDDLANFLSEHRVDPSKLIQPKVG